MNCRWHPKDGIVRNGSGLSPRQRQVMKWIAEGETTKSIALMLKVSNKAVEYHRANLIKRIGVSGVSEITKIAIWWGMTDVVSPLQKQ